MTRTTEKPAEEEEASNPLRLSNRVWDGGYEWVSLEDGRRFLSASGANKKVVNSKSALRHWNLRWALKDIPSSAWREFPLLATEEQIASFASKHGQLSTKLEFEKAANGDYVLGSHLEDWATAIKDVAFWIEMWDMIRDRNTRGLRKRIGFHPDGPEVVTPEGHFPLGEYLVPISFSKSNVIKPALFALRDTINERLKRYPVGASLFLETDSVATIDFQLAFRASGLLAIIWMQIAQKVAGVYSFRPCEFCSKPFYPERKTARFCSAICRVRAWNKNKQDNEASTPHNF